MSELVIFCNPLLDISVDVDAAFLEQYNLKPGNAILAEDTNLHGDKFFSLLSNHSTANFIAGGSAMNTARVCSWLLHDKATHIPKDSTSSIPQPRVAYAGSVGDDEYGKLLRDSAAKSNVDVGAVYIVPKDDSTIGGVVSEKKSTGLCGVCIVGKERSLVARLGAAEAFPLEHIQSNDIEHRFSTANTVYVSGYFLTVCAEGAFRMAKRCSEEGKTFALNLSAPFILQVPPFQAAVKSLLPYCSLLFGNETEAAALADIFGWKSETNCALSVKDIAVRLLGDSGMLPKGAHVCFTMGPDSTILASNESVVEVKVPTVSNIVDTNGAGDSFVGGFLASLLNGNEWTKCVEAGHYAAGVVIQYSGCAYPDHPSYVL